MEDRVLIITDSISISASLVFWVFKNFPVQLQNLNIITQASLLEDIMFFNPSSVSSVVSVSARAGFHTQLWLKQLAKLLRPDGFLLVQEPSYLNHNQQLMLGDTRESLERNLMFSGFCSIEGLESIDLYEEGFLDPRHFELIAMKARKAGMSMLTYPIPEGAPIEKAIVPSGSRNGKQKEPERPQEIIPKERRLGAPKRNRRRKPVPDVNVDVKEKVRERNREYQRRRRAKMTEEQRVKERERRKLYMQRRRDRLRNGSVDEQPILIG